MTEWWRKTAGEIAGAIREQKVSAEEVMESHLARTDQVNGKLNAITVRLDDAATTSRQARTGTSLSWTPRTSSSRPPG